ncbi:hypothetical protein LG943_09660 [Streptomonospora sp. S1-112]|uniref:Uncharacterized protein n=1 Tax=Streptomonospora mangrovi TaxID=2883123 RepID=A0A9X3NJ01_9ACTN|nr:hypothetical protein [Streptomonospora mangrovi]MDA0564592.1 hypothetical protein [Streptomonospora mangrovi]
MFVFAALGVLTLLGLALVGVLALRMLAELHRLRVQVARTRAQVQPGYDRLRSQGEGGPVGAPEPVAGGDVPSKA